eukprot:1140075-Pelagomonas_calceolata.AAC.2
MLRGSKLERHTADGALVLPRYQFIRLVDLLSWWLPYHVASAAATEAFWRPDPIGWWGWGIEPAAGLHTLTWCSSAPCFGYHSMFCLSLAGKRTVACVLGLAAGVFHCLRSFPFLFLHKLAWNIISLLYRPDLAEKEKKKGREEKRKAHWGSKRPTAIVTKAHAAVMILSSNYTTNWMESVRRVRATHPSLRT